MLKIWLCHREMVVLQVVSVGQMLKCLATVRMAVAKKMEIVIIIKIEVIIIKIEVIPTVTVRATVTKVLEIVIIIKMEVILKMVTKMRQHMQSPTLPRAVLKVTPELREIHPHRTDPGASISHLLITTLRATIKVSRNLPHILRAALKVLCNRLLI